MAARRRNGAWKCGRGGMEGGMEGGGYGGEMGGRGGMGVDAAAGDAELFNNRYVGADGAPIPDRGRRIYPHLAPSSSVCRCGCGSGWISAGCRI